LIAAALFAVLPYILGAGIAEVAGAANPSTVRSVVAWMFEGAWVAFWLVFIVTSVRKGRVEEAEHEAARMAAEQIRARQRAEEAARIEREAVIQIAVARKRAHQDPSGRRLPAPLTGPREEALLSDFDDARLLQPRATGRGARQTVVTDTGRLLITTRRIVFVGGQRTVSWDLDKLVDYSLLGDSGLQVAVSSRQGIYGFDLGTRDRLITAWSMAAWAVAVRHGSRESYLANVEHIARRLLQRDGAA
jgi:hypothetical protein